MWKFFIRYLQICLFLQCTKYKSDHKALITYLPISSLPNNAVGLGGLGGLGGLNALAVLFAIKIKLLVVAAIVGLSVFYWMKHSGYSSGYSFGGESIIPYEA